MLHNNNIHNLDYQVIIAALESDEGIKQIHIDDRNRLTLRSADIGNEALQVHVRPINSRRDYSIIFNCIALNHRKFKVFFANNYKNKTVIKNIHSIAQGNNTLKTFANVQKFRNSLYELGLTSKEVDLLLTEPDLLFVSPKAIVRCVQDLCQTFTKEEAIYLFTLIKNEKVDFKQLLLDLPISSSDIAALTSESPLVILSTITDNTDRKKILTLLKDTFKMDIEDTAPFIKLLQLSPQSVSYQYDKKMIETFLPLFTNFLDKPIQERKDDIPAIVHLIKFFDKFKEVLEFQFQRTVIKEQSLTNYEWFYSRYNHIDVATGPVIQRQYGDTQKMIEGVENLLDELKRYRQVPFQSLEDTNCITEIVNSEIHAKNSIPQGFPAQLFVKFLEDNHIYYLTWEEMQNFINSDKIMELKREWSTYYQVPTITKRANPTDD